MNIMNLPEIQDAVEKDIIIDLSQLDSESTRTPELHHKYLRIYTEIQIQYKSSESKYNSCRREKWEHYSGKGERPYPSKLLKADIPVVLEGDEELIRCKDKMEYFKTILQYLEEVLKIINNRSFQINNAVKWQKFSQGEN